MGKKEEKNCCVLTLPLCPEKWQIDIIEKRFRLGEMLYNSLLGNRLKAYRNLAETKHYRQIENRIYDCLKSGDKKGLDAANKERKSMLKEAGITKFGFSNQMTEMYKCFNKQIGSHIAQALSDTAWIAFEKMLFGKGKKVHFKKRGSLNSISNKNANTNMKYLGNYFKWMDIEIKVRKPKTDYEFEILKLPIRRYRVVKKWLKNKFRYYLQITFEGKPPKKEKRTVGVGRVGLDIGTQSVAIASNTDVKLLELADKVNKNDRKLKLLQRKMDRSRRSTNPDNFNEDGTIKRGVKLNWVESNHYKRLRGKVRELHRKNADIRKYQHTCLANYVLSLGTEIYVETMNYSALQRRSTKTEKNDKGKFKRKKRFGKSLANKAPAMFLTILDLKLKMEGYEGLNKVNTWTYKASQYDHLSQQYNKKKLSKRKHDLANGDVVQRDLYSAFLLMCANKTLNHQDDNLCNKFYDNFKFLHDQEVQRLVGVKEPKLSSFGY